MGKLASRSISSTGRPNPPMRSYRTGILALLFALFAFSANAQVAFDAKTTDVYAGGGTTFTSTQLIVGSLANRVLVVQFVNASGGTPSPVTSVTWDQGGTNQAASFIGTATDAAGHTKVELWGLVAPVSGNKTLQVVIGAAGTDNYISAVSFTGANQTGGATTFKNFNSAVGTSAAVSVAITSNANDMVTGALAVTATNISSTSGTNIYIDNGGGAASAAALYDSGASSVSLTSSPNNTFVIAGVDIAAVGGGAATVSNRSLLGVGK